MVLLCLGWAALAEAQLEEWREPRKLPCCCSLSSVRAMCLTRHQLHGRPVPRGHYYDANGITPQLFAERQIHLLWKYAHSSEPARLGLGWDRWFVFLHKGGVSGATLATLGLIMIVGLGISLAGLARNARSTQ